MFYHQPTRSGSEPLVEADRISKAFNMRRQSNRSLQEFFVQLARRKHEPKEVFWPVQDLSFCIRPGESLGIIGPNGSGKSTLLKLITGILECTEGQIVVRGRVSALLELGAGFHPDLTGRENIFLNGSIFGFTQKQMRARLDSIIDFAELGDFIDVPLKHYSSGMHVRLGFAVAMHTDPDLLIVDEVLAVGDAMFQHKCMQAIHEYRAGGGTILLVSHDLSSIQSLCKQVMWLEDGKAQAMGNATEVVMSYLNSVARKEEKKHGSEQLPELEQGQRWGSGGLEISDVQLCDATGAERSVFVTGAPLLIKVHYRAKGRVEAPVFGLALHSDAGVQVCGPNTRFDNFTIPSVEGEGTITYRVPFLPLLAGDYLVSVAAVNSDDSTTFDYHDRAYRFRVNPGGCQEQYGLLTLGGEWERS